MASRSSRAGIAFASGAGRIMSRVLAVVAAGLLLLQAAFVWGVPPSSSINAATATTTAAPSIATCTTTPATFPVASESDATPELRLRRPAPPSATVADLPPSSADVALPDARGPPEAEWAQVYGARNLSPTN